MVELSDHAYTTGTYWDKNPTFHVEDSEWKADQIVQMLLRNRLSPHSVGEVGCGAGRVLREVQTRLGTEVELDGYDISPQAIERCRPLANERLRFHCDDLFSVETHAFDLLLCIDVFEHVEDYMTFLRRLRSKASFLLFHTPLDLSAEAIVRQTLPRKRAELGHLHHFTKESALATIEDTGYEVLDWWYTPSGIDRAETFKARAARVPRRVLFSARPDLTVRLLGGYSLMTLAK
jgi:SAM-dependent methyltransferase